MGNEELWFDALEGSDSFKKGKKGWEVFTDKAGNEYNFRRTAFAEFLEKNPSLRPEIEELLDYELIHKINNRSVLDV